MAMSFDYPLVLLSFALLIPLVLYDHFSAQKKMVYKILPKNLRIKRSLSRLFFRLFVCCGIIVLAGPRWGIGQSEAEHHRMADAVIALDISRSMEVLDGQSGNGDPAGSVSRIERGLSIVREAVEALPGMRFAITISRNRGIITIPLTWDNVTVLAFLNAAGDAAGHSITGRGTNLESLLDTAASAFQSSYPSARVILLVSDGEALSGSISAALERCSRNEIAVTAIAVGSDEGGIVAGEGILSRRDSRVMRTAAGQTGGIYIDGNREDAARTLINHLRFLGPFSVENAGSEAGTKEAKSQWLVFLVLAIIAFGASKLCLLRLGMRS
jgi:Ca-activated chloride channel family protein